MRSTSFSRNCATARPKKQIAGPSARVTGGFTLRLIVEPEGLAVETEGRSVLVGSASHCEIRVASADHEHARIASNEVEAIGICRVGGVKLKAGRRRQLAPDSTIEVGEVRIVVEDAAVSIAALSTRAAAFQLGVTGPQSVSIWVTEGERPGTLVELQRGVPLIVGRRGGDRRWLVHDEQVSRDHAEILWDQNFGVLVRDLGSARGTYLGRHRLVPQQRAVWPSGKMLLIGRTVLGIEVPALMRTQLQRAIERAPQEAPLVADLLAEADPPAEPEVTRSTEVGAVSHEAPAPIATPPDLDSSAPLPPLRQSRSRVRMLMVGLAGILVLLFMLTLAWLASGLITTSARQTPTFRGAAT
ncbi:hypothetical protein BH11MYX4_BH11MYX4_23160 [soil metagenome]